MLSVLNCRAVVARTALVSLLSVGSGSDAAGQSSDLGKTRRLETKALIGSATGICDRGAVRASGMVELRPSGPTGDGNALLDVGALNVATAYTLSLVADARLGSPAGPIAIVYRCNGRQALVAPDADVAVMEMKTRAVLPPSPLPYRIAVSGSKGVPLLVTAEPAGLSVTSYAAVAADGTVTIDLSDTTHVTPEGRIAAFVDLHSVQANLNDDDIVLIQNAQPTTAQVEPGKFNAGFQFGVTGKLFSPQPLDGEKVRGALWKLQTGNIIRVSIADTEAPAKTSLRILVLRRIRTIPPPAVLTKTPTVADLDPSDPLRDELSASSGNETVKRLQPFKLFIFKPEAGKLYNARVQSADFDPYVSIGVLSASINGVTSERSQTASGQTFYAIASNDDVTTSTKDACIAFSPATDAPIIVRVMPAGRPSFGSFTLSVDQASSERGSCTPPRPAF